MSETGLGDALKSKKEKRARQGASAAQKAAAPSAVDWAELGRTAERQDRQQRPRRKQTNIDLPEDLKREFKAELQARGLQMRFVVEDLIRLYMERAT